MTKTLRFVKQTGAIYRVLLETPAGCWLIDCNGPSTPFFAANLDSYERVPAPESWISEQTITPAQEARLKMIQPLLDCTDCISDKSLRYQMAAEIAQQNQTTTRRILRLYPGDTIVVTEPSRLSRSVQQFCQIVETIKSKRIRLQILGSITIDCRTTEPDPMTVAFLQLIAVFSELELSMIRARVRSGVANARAKGKQLGRPSITVERIPDSFFRYYAKYQCKEINVTELARLAQVSRPTVYRYLSAIRARK